MNNNNFGLVYVIILIISIMLAAGFNVIETSWFKNSVIFYLLMAVGFISFTFIRNKFKKN